MKIIDVRIFQAVLVGSIMETALNMYPFNLFPNMIFFIFDSLFLLLVIYTAIKISKIFAAYKIARTLAFCFVIILPFMCFQYIFYHIMNDYLVSGRVIIKNGEITRDGWVHIVQGAGAALFITFVIAIVYFRPRAGENWLK